MPPCVIEAEVLKRGLGPAIHLKLTPAARLKLVGEFVETSVELDGINDRRTHVVTSRCITCGCALSCRPLLDDLITDDHRIVRIVIVMWTLSCSYMQPQATFLTMSSSARTLGDFLALCSREVPHIYQMVLKRFFHPPILNQHLVYMWCLKNCPPFSTEASCCSTEVLAS